jgi:Tfp pilus assembly protein FimT
VELMVAVLILGLLLAIAAPGFARYMRSWRLNGQANEMAATLRLARAAAVSKNTTVLFVFDVSNGEYFYFEDDDESGSHGAGEYQSGLHEFSPGINIDSFSMGQQWITFGPKGNTVDGGSIILENQEHGSRRIRVFSGTGNITVD